LITGVFFSYQFYLFFEQLLLQGQHCDTEKEISYNMNTADKFLKSVAVCKHREREYSNPFTGPVGSRRLSLPDFKTIGTWRW